MKMYDASNEGQPPDHDRTPTVMDRSVRSTGPTDQSVDIGDAAMKARLARKMFGAEATPPRIGRYRIERKIGRGGMGIVFEALDEELDRHVAIKLLNPELDERHAIRMRREAQALARLSHANVVHVYEVGTHEGGLFLAMEFVDGQPLSKWQQAHRREWRAVLDKYIQAGRGLEAAHAAGIVHRDFKPSNVVVSKDGSVRVLDFGLARSVGAMTESESRGMPLDELSALDLRVTVTGTTMGTPRYMSPEQMVGGPITTASDQFSFCVALYEGLYGELPFPGEGVTEIHESLLFERIRPAPPRTQVPARVRAVLLRGLRRDVSQRHASMRELLRALEGPTTFKRWRPVVALGTIATLGGVWSVFAGDPPCEDGADLAENDWAARRPEIEAAFASTSLDYQANVLAGVDARVSEWTTAWRARYADACALEDEQTRRARLACLDERRASLGAFTGVLASGGSGVLDQALRLVDELPSAKGCAVEIDTTDHAQERVALLAARLDALAGREEAAQTAATTVLEQAQRTGADALVGEALYTLALVDLRNARRTEGLARLRQAVEAGLAADADLLVADAWLEMARLEAHQPSTLEQSRAHTGQARALLTRHARGSDTLVGDRAARLAWIEGELAFVAEDIATAEAKLREAVEGLEAAHGRNSFLVTEVQNQLANVLAVQGNVDAALRLYDSARATLAGVAGDGYPFLHVFDYGIALVHLDLGEYENAEHRLRAGLRVLEGTGAAWAEQRGMLLVALAHTYEYLGRMDDGLQAARAARAELAESVPPGDLSRRGADDMIGTFLQGLGDLDGAAEAFRSLAAGHEAANDSRAAAEVRARLVTIELRRDRPSDAAAVLERHRATITERFGAEKVRVLENAIAAMQALAGGDRASGRAGLERVREAIGVDEVDEAVQWCDVRAWATLALARSLATDDPAHAQALAAEAKAHLTETPHDPGLRAEIDAFVGS